MDDATRGLAGAFPHNCHPPRPPTLEQSVMLSRCEQEYLDKLKQCEAQKPPPQLVEAAAAGPLPLVWAFRRARRARPLPPAYVLMYHCERHVQLDHSYLATSLTQHYNRTTKNDFRVEFESGPGDLPSAPSSSLPRSYYDPEVLQAAQGLMQNHDMPSTFDIPKTNQTMPLGGPSVDEPVIARKAPVVAQPTLSTHPPTWHPMLAPAVVSANVPSTRHQNVAFCFPTVAKAGESPSASCSTNDAEASYPVANLDALLESLSGQLSAGTYAMVQDLVQDIRLRRVTMSRDEFINKFTSIIQNSQ